MRALALPAVIEDAKRRLPPLSEEQTENLEFTALTMINIVQESGVDQLELIRNSTVGLINKLSAEIEGTEVGGNNALRAKQDALVQGQQIAIDIQNAVFDAIKSMMQEP